MTKYPLIEAMGLKVRRILEDNSAVYRDVYIIEADDLEAALEKAPVVRMPKNLKVWTHIYLDDDSHTARLICVEEIKKDTAESLLKELLELFDQASRERCELSAKSVLERARKLLEGK